MIHNRQYCADAEIASARWLKYTILLHFRGYRYLRRYIASCYGTDIQ